VTKTIIRYKRLIISYLRVEQFGLASGMLRFNTELKKEQQPNRKTKETNQ
jgi:hypothetical protein